MKYYPKFVKIFIVMLILSVNPVYSQSTLGDLRDGLEGFSDKLALSLPFNSTIGLNWSDAYIGQLIDAPPRLGVGFSSGFTTMAFDSAAELLKQFGADFPGDIPLVNFGFPMPGYTIDARVGGFMLPFDVGVKFGYLDLKPDVMGPAGEMLNLDLGMHYILIGGDFRYALIEGEVLPFQLSVGIGFNYMEGGITTTISAGQEFKFDDYTLSIPDPKLGLGWRTNCLDLKAQIAFPLKVITPYAGLGVSHAWSEVGYSINSKIQVNDGAVNLDEVKHLLEKFGLSGITGNGFEAFRSVTGWSARMYGGISFNVPFVRFDLTGMFNFVDAAYGATFGLRFQL
ncbi:MAG: hypothetical protein LBU66_05035 [Treponema sp.]|jgi:hypothetical protein|nr:hypothetical protein [Treponema sp.]